MKFEYVFFIILFADILFSLFLIVGLSLYLVQH